MNTAMVVTWRSVVPGREVRALQYAQEVDAFWEKAAADGKCSPPEIFFSRGGNKSIWMVKGDFDTLRETARSDEARNLESMGMLLLGDFAIEFMETGEAAAAAMADSGAAVSALGLT